MTAFKSQGTMSYIETNCPAELDPPLVEMLSVILLKEESALLARRMS